MNLIRSSKLKSGIQIISEAMPGQNSISIGIWLRVGSRNESENEIGAAHFLEHVLFKGTKNRTALEISNAMEAIGGESNAFTNKESTCFYVRVISKDLPLAIEILCDQITSSIITEEAFETERKVVQGEIDGRKDSPISNLFELFETIFFGKSSLGRTISGNRNDIDSLNRESVISFYKKNYIPKNIVVSAAGNLEHEKLVELIELGFNKKDFDKAISSPVESVTPAFDELSISSFGNLKMPIGQAHILYGLPGVPLGNEDQQKFNLVSCILGMGMGSRLFQEVREKRSLVYNISADINQYSDAGYFSSYAACEPKDAREVLKLIKSNLEDIAENGANANEIKRAKGFLSGTTVLGQDDVNHRMYRLGRLASFNLQIRTLDEILDRIDKISIEEIKNTAQQILKSKPTIAIVGPEFSASDF